MKRLKGREMRGREKLKKVEKNVLLFKVEQEGAGACHTGARTCFFRSFG